MFSWAFPGTGGWLAGALPVETLNLFYNIGDAINKIGFGLVIYALAVSKSDKVGCDRLETPPTAS